MKTRFNMCTQRLILACAALAVLSAGCFNSGNPWQKGKDQAAFFAVAVTEAVRGTLNDYLEVNGDVETQTSVDVFADTIGKISRIYVSVGSRITKDSVIAEVDPSRPGSTFVVSPVRSPINGTVTSIPLQVGATVMAGIPVARMAATDLVQVRTNVAERFVSRMRTGLSAILSFDAYPGVHFPAHVSEVSPVLDPASRTLEVKIRLASPDARIKPGMFARVKIVTETRLDVVKVPSEAIVKRFDESFVFVVMEKKESVTGFAVEKRKVIQGIDIDEKSEIVEGLKAGEKVIVQGQTLLEDQQAIKIVATVPSLDTDDPVE